tara:strand:+ start:5826 stop:6149 length:324 start_codon:yes stop_codon:yes gene_type:complete
MSNYNDDKDGFDPMEEIKQKELDDILLEDAFNNSYMILMKELTFNDVLDNAEDYKIEAVLAFDPEVGPKLRDLENMISWFIECEDYEKCAKIKALMNNKYPDSVLTE